MELKKVDVSKDVYATKKKIGMYRTIIYGIIRSKGSMTAVDYYKRLIRTERNRILKEYNVIID